MSESVPSPERGREAYRAELARELGQEQAAHARRVQLIMLVFLPIAAILAWLLLVGYQRHVLEIRGAAGTVRIISGAGPFEIQSPNSDFANLRSGGMLTYLSDEVRSHQIEPRAYDWASVAMTQQIVTLPQGVTTSEFLINDQTFKLVGSKLVCGARMWTLVPGGTVTIDLDRLPPAIPGP